MPAEVEEEQPLVPRPRRVFVKRSPPAVELVVELMEEGLEAREIAQRLQASRMQVMTAMFRARQDGLYPKAPRP